MQQRLSLPAEIEKYLETLKIGQGRYAGQDLVVLPWQSEFLRGAFSQGGLRQDMARLGSRLDERINGLESRLDGSIKALESRFDGLERQFGELRERMAHLEGLLEDYARPSPGGSRPAKGHGLGRPQY